MSTQAVLFPGQGAQFVGMSADLVDRCPAAGALFEAASRLMGVDLWKLTTEGPAEVLSSTTVSQPAIFVVSMAVVRLLEEMGAGDRLTAMGTAGLSLGEYSALVFSGAISFETALELVVRRGEYMQEACDRHPSGMTSILGLDLESVRGAVAEASSEGVVAVANVNADLQIVISGEHAALEKAAELARQRGARRTVSLRVAGAYHSPLMASASDKLGPWLEKAEIRAPRVPFYPNVEARVTSDPQEIRSCLLRQIESAVLWAPTLKELVRAGMSSAVEPGPGKVIAGLVRQVDREIPVHSLLTGESIEAFLSA